jgi:hypothetical protein
VGVRDPQRLGDHGHGPDDDHDHVNVDEFDREADVDDHDGGVDDDHDHDGAADDHYDGAADDDHDDNDGSGDDHYDRTADDDDHDGEADDYDDDRSVLISERGVGCREVAWHPTPKARHISKTGRRTPRDSRWGEIWNAMLSRREWGVGES